MKNPKCTPSERMILISSSKDTFVVAMCIYNGYKQGMKRTGDNFICDGRGDKPLLEGSFPVLAKEPRAVAPVGKVMEVGTLHSDLAHAGRLYGASRVLARVEPTSIILMFFQDIYASRIWSVRFDFNRERICDTSFDAGQLTALVKELHQSKTGRYEMGV